MGSKVAPSPLERSVSKPQIYMGRRVVPIPHYPFRQVVGAPAGEWTAEIFECCSDPSILLCTLFCPCVQVGRNIEIITDGKTGATTGCVLCVLSIFSCLYTCGYRSKLRQKYLLPQQPCGDCPTHCFCHCCAVCQEGQELKNRGWDPALGYSGNLRDFSAHGMAPPPLVMTR